MILIVKMVYSQTVYTIYLLLNCTNEIVKKISKHYELRQTTYCTKTISF